MPELNKEVGRKEGTHIVAVESCKENEGTHYACASGNARWSENRKGCKGNIGREDQEKLFHSCMKIQSKDYLAHMSILLWKLQAAR
jgi:hypothetical protein